MNRRVFFFLLSLFIPFSSFTIRVEANEIFDTFPPQAEREIQYSFPTKRFIDAHGWSAISSGLVHLGVSMVHRNLLDRVWQREEPGFIGYHGSTQDYRIFQDIIKMILEEHVAIPIRDDFHFLRIPGNPRFHHCSLQEYGSCTQNYSPAHFLCMNYALYGNFRNHFSCSYYYFAANSSLTRINYEPELTWLFDKVGIDTSTIKLALAIGRDHLAAEKGILLQVFDMSHYNPWKTFYHEADLQCGQTNDLRKTSKIFIASSPYAFPGQIRLLMSNQHSLNPNSPLVVRRYDALSPEVVRDYERKLRECIRNLKSNEEKVKQYKEELFAAWEVSDDQI